MCCRVAASCSHGPCQRVPGSCNARPGSAGSHHARPSSFGWRCRLRGVRASAARHGWQGCRPWPAQNLGSLLTPLCRGVLPRLGRRQNFGFAVSAESIENMRSTGFGQVRGLRWRPDGFKLRSLCQMPGLRREPVESPISFRRRRRARSERIQGSSCVVRRTGNMAGARIVHAARLAAPESCARSQRSARAGCACRHAWCASRAFSDAREAAHSQSIRTARVASSRQAQPACASSAGGVDGA